MEVKSIVFFLFLSRILRILGRDLSEVDRNSRAAFVQKLLNRNRAAEGRVKLVGGPTRFEGNVLIQHAGRWGAVCDDSWDDAAAAVVCAALNRTGSATRGAQYGEATEHYWMDDVVCEGNELSLSQCKFSGWGSSDCDPSEAAGVICRKETDQTEGRPKSKELRLPIHEVLDVGSASLRLVGGASANEGRVELYHHGVWGSICPDGWTLYEAIAVCHHLGLGFAQQALQTDAFGHSRIVLSGVQCEGNETNLFQCGHRAYGNVVCTGDVEQQQQHCEHAHSSSEV
ncbi:hypothetical protein JYU34_019360 [Plutella xylostella]|uniref:SRCR domain-containing protein n=1 Tax=Plutella xylostella TaxID=51655 RepID=A0ABQ7PWM4_PLUXY|nr:hypothetical protein JYU34_019360 [Plutella xylostella]